MGDLEDEMKKAKEEAEEAARNAAKAAGNEEDEVGGPWGGFLFFTCGQQVKYFLPECSASTTLVRGSHLSSSGRIKVIF